MSYEELIGRHLPASGEGITGEDLYQLLKSMPSRARNNYVTVANGDLIGLNIAKSDQSQRWEFKLHLIGDGEDDAR